MHMHARALASLRVCLSLHRCSSGHEATGQQQVKVSGPRRGYIQARTARPEGQSCGWAPAELNWPGQRSAALCCALPHLAQGLVLSSQAVQVSALCVQLRQQPVPCALQPGSLLLELCCGQRGLWCRSRCCCRPCTGPAVEAGAPARQARWGRARAAQACAVQGCLGRGRPWRGSGECSSPRPAGGDRRGAPGVPWPAPAEAAACIGQGVSCHAWVARRRQCTAAPKLQVTSETSCSRQSL